MPIESVSQYKEASEEKIKKCRIVTAGEQAVHAVGEDYLSKLDDMNKEQYEAYKNRTMFFNATNRTIDGLVGNIFRKEIQTEFDTLFEQFADDVTKTNVPFDLYVTKVVNEVLEVGLCGTLVDFSNVQAGTSKAKAEQVGYGVNWTLYIAENIRNWDYQIINGVKRLSLVTLDEDHVIDDSDIFEKVVVNAIRVLKLDENLKYVNELWIKDDDESEYKLIESVFPKMQGEEMDFIPFMLHFPEMDTNDIKPPLLDLVNVNIKHYQLKADHAHALHFVALPTPWITGIDPSGDDTPSSVGPSKLWIIPNEEAKVGMLEFTGAGIESIEKELTRMEQMMAQLGAKILMPSKDFAETATAEKIKATGETSMLASIVSAINLQINIVSSWSALWMNASKFESKINKDFVVSRMSPQEIVALIAAWQKGAISKETMFENLKKGEVIDSEANFDEEELKIDNELGTELDEEDLDLDD